MSQKQIIKLLGVLQSPITRHNYDVTRQVPVLFRNRSLLFWGAE